MTRHAPLPHAAPQSDAPRQLAQLRQLLLLIERIAGRQGRDDADAALDEAARIGAAYGEALPVLQRRLDGLTAETSAWAAAGVEALSRAGGSPAAAARLADELRDALNDIASLLKL
jgi:ABC-type transporter Mla subunit MlaD